MWGGRSPDIGIKAWEDFVGFRLPGLIKAGAFVGSLPQAACKFGGLYRQPPIRNNVELREPYFEPLSCNPYSPTLNP